MKEKTGYPSIDRIHDNAYSYFKRNPIIPNMSIYNAIMLINSFNKKINAIECADLNINYDLLVVEYADIMRPEMNFSEKRDGLTSIYEDLRAIGQHYDLAVLTATQTNREGVKAKVADMTHVAEDLGKIRTADIVISINCTDEEKMLNEARLFFAASRTGEMDITLKIKRDISKGKFITKVLAKS